ITTSGFEAAIFKSRLPVTSDTIRNSIFEFQKPENMGVAVGILLLGAIEAEICCEHFVYESGYILLVKRLPSWIFYLRLPWTASTIEFVNSWTPKMWGSR